MCALCTRVDIFFSSSVIEHAGHFLILLSSIGEDYSVASTDVVLLEGESSKSVPIYVINDMVPELQETFVIELINQTTGGALLGELTRAIITILPSDDPFGAFG